MCHLFHPPNQISRQRPVGFQACTNPINFVPDDLSWHLSRRNVGTMNAIEIGVCMRMACTTLNEDAEGDLGEPIPENMAYPRPLSRTFDLGTTSLPPTPARAKWLEQDSAIIQQSSFVGETDLSGGDSERETLAAETSKRNARREMPNEKSASSSAVSPSLAYFIGCTLIGPTTRQTLNSSRKRSLVPTQILEPDETHQSDLRHPRLLPGKLLDMSAKRRELELRHEQLGTQIEGRIDKCQCGFNQEEDQMVSPRILPSDCMPPLTPRTADAVQLLWHVAASSLLWFYPHSTWRRRPSLLSMPLGRHRAATIGRYEKTRQIPTCPLDIV